MRAQYDNSRLEAVRKKVAKLKMSVLIAENKIRDARKYLMAGPEERLRKVLGLRLKYERHVNQRSLVTKIDPLYDLSYRNTSFHIFKAHLELRSSAYDNKISGGKGILKYTIVVSDDDRIIIRKKESVDTLLKPSNKPQENMSSQVQSMSYKMHEARNKSSNAVRMKFEALREMLHGLERKISRTKTRVEKSDSCIKVLSERLNFLVKRVKAHRMNIKCGLESREKISHLENRLSATLNKAIEVENREAFLETRVLEIEDNIEVYNMKIQRAQRVLYRMNQGKIPGNTCTVTMVLRRISLSSQTNLMKPPSSPALLQATYSSEESD